MGFLQGYTTQKLKQNQRSLKSAYAEVNKMSHEIADLEDELEVAQISLDSRHCDLEARVAREEYLMSLLDDAYGQDKNPARQPAYPDDAGYKIPVGNRKGQVVTKADHIYVMKYIDFFEKQFEKKWEENVENWIEFLHPKISI
jgi:hypothetical protein